METGDVVQDRTRTEAFPKWWLATAGAKEGPAVDGNGGGGDRTLPPGKSGDVLRLFADEERFGERLDFIDETLEVIAQAWSDPSSSDPAATLGVLQELAKNGVVPPGREHVQDTLMRAIRLYREAAEGIYRAKLDGRPFECDEAWQCVMEGHALLGSAIRMTPEK